MPSASWSGGTDRFGRAVVVKVDRSAERHQREADVLATLRAGEVPVPEVLDTSPADEAAAWVLVLERVDGRPLGPDDDAPAWSAVGEALARLHHSVTGPVGPPFAGHPDGSFAGHLRAWADHDRRLGADDGWMTPAQAERLGALVDEATAHTDDVAGVLLHGDCAPWHWLLGPMATPPRPVDLGDAGVGDPAYDLMVLTLTTPARLNAVLDGYGADGALRDHLASVLPGYRALRLAGQVSWLREHGYDPSPSHAGLRDALR